MSPWADFVNFGQNWDARLRFQLLSQTITIFFIHWPEQEGLITYYLTVISQSGFSPGQLCNRQRFN